MLKLRTTLLLVVSSLCIMTERGMCEEKEKVEQPQLTEGLGMSMDEITTRMKKIFSYVDENSDSKVTYEESVAWLNKINNKLTARAIRVEMDSLDDNKDGIVTIEEIFAKYGPEQEQDPLFKEKLEIRIKAVDTDGDNAISAEEAKRFLYPSTDAELVELDAEDIIQQQDSDHDGTISKKEFLEHLTASTDAPEDQERLSADFDEYDSNKDGKLDKSELTTILFEPKDAHIEDAKVTWEQLVGNENATLTLEDYLTNVTQWAVSHITDMGEVLRFPRQFDLDMEDIEVDSSDDGTDISQDSSDSDEDKTKTENKDKKKDNDKKQKDEL